MSDLIIFNDVSKFYGDVLGINGVSLRIGPGITSLVGPNGSGKTTFMNLLTGLVHPTRGTISVLGMTPDDPVSFFRNVGYCAQFDSFPRYMTGFKFVYETLRLHGTAHAEAKRLAEEAIERVNLSEAAGRNVESYSKGMRQRIRLAQAIAHHPKVLVLDEPLNGLDPMARAESIALFESLGAQGMYVLISSHIMHEVDRISDRVILMSSGYVVAEGNIHNVRSEMKEHPMQVMVRCSNPAALASQFFQLDSLVEARIDTSGEAVFFRTRDANKFYLLLNKVASAGHIDVESVSPADDDVKSLYQYLISNDGAQE